MRIFRETLVSYQHPLCLFVLPEKKIHFSVVYFMRANMRKIMSDYAKSWQTKYDCKEIYVVANFSISSESMNLV